MKAKTLPSEDFQGKGVLDFTTSNSTSFSLDSFSGSQNQTNLERWLNTSKGKVDFSHAGSECTSLVDTKTTTTTATRSPSSSTLSSTHNSGGGGGGDTTSVAAEVSDKNKPCVDSIGKKCGMGSVEDVWESVALPDYTAGGGGGSSSPSQEHSILRLIMGDIEDPSFGLTKLLQGSGNINGVGELDFNGGGFGVLDHQGFGFVEPPSSATAAATTTTTNNNIEASSSQDSCSDFNQQFHGRSSGGHNVRLPSVTNSIPCFSVSGHNNNNNNNNNNLDNNTSCAVPVSMPLGVLGSESLDEKPQIFNPQGIVNQSQVQFAPNPSLFMPLGYNTQMQDHHMSPPQPKRLNSGATYLNYPVSRTLLDTGQQELFVRRQQQQLQLHPQQFQPRPAPVMKQKMVSDELVIHQFQQTIIDQLYKAVELIETGNLVLAQGILARLNQQLSPIGKPFLRAAFYFMEALQLLLHSNNTNPSTLSPFTLIYKIGAYKSFSEISPVLQFTNFTCNQALLEALEGYDRVHILSFDVGYGEQWAPLMKELSLRNGGPPSLKITAFASTSTPDELELVLTQETLKHFADEINMALEFEVISFESFASGSWMLPFHASDGEAVAVNFPISSFSNYPAYLSPALRFVKQLSPKIVVCWDRGCDRTDIPFPHHMVHALQCHTNLFESLDALNVNVEVLQKIERYLFQPGIEKMVVGRHQSPERLAAWRSLFLSSGFSQVAFSSFNETQAECLVHRSPVRGFVVEKRQHSLVLCWQRKELISASAWRC